MQVTDNADLYADQWQAIDAIHTFDSTDSINTPITHLDPIITHAINNLTHDAGAVFEFEVLTAFKQLFQQAPASYARYRQQIKDSKCVSMALFDKFTQPSFAQTGEVEVDPLAKLFYPLEIYPEPIEVEQLLNEIKETIRCYVIADDETIIAATLWACFTWFIEVVNYAPIANITAPEKRCGKTKLLSVLKRLSYNSLITANISPAALFRLIEQCKPTLLIDEVDSFLNAHEDMRGIINAGFTRESSLIVRCVGDEHELASFNVWGAKALCGIGKIADTLQDRSIPLKLRRKTQGETVLNVDKSAPKQWAMLRSKLARLAEDHKLTLLTSPIEPIPQLNDRANDCFEPLLQIASLAGDNWLTQAKQAAIQLSGEQEDNSSSRTELLNDIKTLFDTKKIERIFSHDLVTALNEDNEANWCTWNRGKGITARNLAKILKEFNILSNTIRIGFSNPAKGYIKDQFNDAFKRYLTPSSLDTPYLSVTTSQSLLHNENSQNSIRYKNQMLRIEKPLHANNNKECNVVTDNIFPSRARDSQLSINPLHNNQPNLTTDNDDEAIYFDLD